MYFVFCIFGHVCRVIEKKIIQLHFCNVVCILQLNYFLKKYFIQRCKRYSVRISAVVIRALQVRLYEPAAALSGSNHGQVAHTRSSATEQYNLVPANGRWCSEAGNVTVEASRRQAGRPTTGGSWCPLSERWYPVRESRTILSDIVGL